jgi:hypothetical protein
METVLVCTIFLFSVMVAVVIEKLALAGLFWIMNIAKLSPRNVSGHQRT